MDVRANWLHCNGLNGRHWEISAFLKLEILIKKKDGDLYHTINCKMGCVRTSELVWPLKWTGMAVRVNRLLSQGLNGRLGNMSAFEVGNLDKQQWWWAIIHDNCLKGSMLSLGLFEIGNGPSWPWVLIGYVANVITDVHEIIWHFWSRNSGSQKNTVS